MAPDTMGSDATGGGTGSDPAVPPFAWRRPRLAALVFALLVVAAAVALAVAGRGQWFFGDDWAMLHHRGDAGARVWLKPYQQHLTALPTVVYQVLWGTVGLRSYRPYQAVALASHLAAATALWFVVRRCGVGGWTATLVGAALLFTGVASDVALWAVLMAFSAAIAFGFAHLLVADAPDRRPGRWALAVACGTASLLCTSVGLFVLGVSGLALAARQGWRWAAAVVAPPLGLYVLWYTIWGRSAPRTASELGDVAAFSVRVVTSTATGTAGSWPIALGLAALVVGGAALAVATPRPSGSGRRRELAIPAAGVVGIVAFALANGWSRAGRYGVEYAERGRFAYVVLALGLPLVAVALDAIAVRGVLPAVLVWSVLAATTVGGLHRIEPQQPRDYTPAQVLAVAASPSLQGAPADLAPFPGAYGLGWTTVGWFREQVAAGRFPEEAVSPAAAADARTRLALSVGPADPTLDDCTPLAEPVAVELGAGAPLGFTGAIEVVVVGRDGARATPRSFGSLELATLRTTYEELPVIVAPSPTPYPVELCRPG